MHVRRTATFIGIFALASTACAVAAEPPGAEQTDRSAPRQCFYARSVNAFNAPDDRTVYIRAGVRDVYELRIFGTCPDIDWNNRIALVSRGGGGYVCSGFDADLVVPDGPFGPQRCTVRAVKKLTPEEVEALPPKHRP